MKKDWEIKKLGDLVTQINGLWKGKKEPFINVAVIRNTNFSKDCKLKLDDVEYLDVELKQYSSRKLQAGDIIIEKSGGSDKQPVGRPILFNIEDGEYSFSNFTSTLRIKDVSQVSAEYLQQYLYFLWLNGDTRNLQSHTTGIHNLDFKAYLNFDIILPPLEEQKRIVKILDEKFAQLETIKANAQTNLQNAKDLFQSQLAKAFSNTTWEKKRLGDLCSKIGSGATPKGGKDSYKTEGIHLVRSMNVYDNKFVYDELACIDDKQAYELRNVELQENDVLFNITGASVCRCCILPSEVLPARVNQHVSILRPKQEQLNPTFLCSAMLGYKEILYKMACVGGSTRQAITKSQLEDFEIPLPPLPEQKRIVKELDTLSEKVRQLQEIYTKQIANCEELKQSLLQKAFEGEL